MLKFAKKIKTWKIYILIASIISVIWKAVEYGKIKERNKTIKQIFKNIKKSKETDEIIDRATDDELAKLL
ncbi:MAG: hypothetical protein BV456_01085 [Thermoplasmata archaeon M8B2D]|nr:MAG: hypothetical protein BV456_01085 [Thermoplasmata archaeon M8B2D]